MQVSHFTLVQEAAKLRFRTKEIPGEPHRKAVLYKGDCPSWNSSRRRIKQPVFAVIFLEKDSIHSVHIAVHKVHKPVRYEISVKRSQLQGCNQLLASCPRSSQSGHSHKSPLALWRCPWTCVKCCVFLHERLPRKYGLHP